MLNRYHAKNEGVHRTVMGRSERCLLCVPESERQKGRELETKNRNTRYRWDGKSKQKTTAVSKYHRHQNA